MQVVFGQFSRRHCHRAPTGMLPFVMAMEEGRYSLWRLRVDDDDEVIFDRAMTCVYGTLICLTIHFSSIICYIVHVAERSTADSNCSEYRYYSCLTQSILRNHFFTYYYYRVSHFSDIMNGRWSGLAPLCVYVSSSWRKMFWLMFRVSYFLFCHLSVTVGDRNGIRPVKK